MEKRFKEDLEVLSGGTISGAGLATGAALIRSGRKTSRPRFYGGLLLSTVSLLLAALFVLICALGDDEE